MQKTFLAAVGLRSTPGATSWAQPHRWLMLILGVLILIHLTLVARFRGVGQLGISVLCWSAAIHLLWKRVLSLNLQSGLFATLLGLALVLLVLSNSVHFVKGDFIHLAPILTGIGVALMASGFRGVRQYWRELVILFFLGVPRAIIPRICDISPVTARFSGMLLWYSGFDVSVTGIHVAIPGGSVNVDGGCDGMEAITYLLCLAVLFLVLFPTTRLEKVIAPMIAISAAFVANAVRVAVLALISAPTKRRVFDFWHEGQGSLLWTVFPVLVFGAYCWFLLRKRKLSGDARTMQA